LSNEIDPLLEQEARRIANEMGNPKVTEIECDIYFGRRPGALSPDTSSKILYAYSVARLVARKLL